MRDDGQDRSYQVSNAAANSFAFRASLADYEIRFPAESRRRGPRPEVKFMTEKCESE